MGVIIIAVHRDTPTGEDMTTGITLTSHTLAGFTITNVNTIPGNKEAEDTTGATIGSKEESPLTKIFIKGLLLFKCFIWYIPISSACFGQFAVLHIPNQLIYRSGRDQQ